MNSHKHTAAFVLLFLAKEGELYGTAVLKTLRGCLPYYNGDSAAIYRTLQKLEEESYVKARWETDTGGPARKWYSITKKGLKSLGGFKEDMLMRKKNTDMFIKIFDSLAIEGQDKKK